MNLSNLTKQIESVLAEADPAGLTGHGVPPDEYRNEAIEISSNLRTGQSPEEVRQIVIDVFHRNFDYVYRLAKTPRIRWCRHAILLIKDGPVYLMDPDNVIEEQASDKDMLPLLQQAAADIYGLMRRAVSSGGLDASS